MAERTDAFSNFEGRKVYGMRYSMAAQVMEEVGLPNIPEVKIEPPLDQARNTDFVRITINYPLGRESSVYNDFRTLAQKATKYSRRSSGEENRFEKPLDVDSLAFTEQLHAQLLDHARILASRR